MNQYSLHARAFYVASVFHSFARHKELAGCRGTPANISQPGLRYAICIGIHLIWAHTSLAQRAFFFSRSLDLNQNLVSEWVQNNEKSNNWASEKGCNALYSEPVQCHFPSLLLPILYLLCCSPQHFLLLTCFFAFPHPSLLLFHRLFLPHLSSLPLSLSFSHLQLLQHHWELIKPLT